MRVASTFKRSEFRGFVLLAMITTGLIWSLQSSASKLDRTARYSLTTIDSTQLPQPNQLMYAPAYATTEGRSSALGMNNPTNHSITVHVTLYNKDGLSLTVPDITLGAHQNHAFDIAGWVNGTDGFETGSIMVVYQGHSMELGAQETITDANHSLTFDVHLQEPMDFMSSAADGLWWALDNQTTAEVFICNTSATQVIATPTFYVGGIGFQGDAIILAGHESDSIDIKHSLSKLHVRGNIGTGGISLSYSLPGAVAAVGAISNKQKGFSTNDAVH